MEDNEIIELFWQRSQRAIAETDGKYGGRLQSLSMNILHDREDAEECVNDTYHQHGIRCPPSARTIFLHIWQNLRATFHSENMITTMLRNGL